jgi:transposase-like protein
MGVVPSVSTISRLNQTLTEQFEAWRERPLQAHWRILYLDGVHFNVLNARPNRLDDPFNRTGRGSGRKQRGAGGCRACAEESKDGWVDLLQDMRARGATQVDLIVTDGHDGLLAAVSALFTATLRQRCVVHKQRSAHECHS